MDSRINKVLSMRTDSVPMLEALDAISEFYGKEGNTVDARRSLRQDLELQNIYLAKKFLIEFDEVRQRIESVEHHAKTLESNCQLLSTRVSSADANMKSFMEKASELEKRKTLCVEQSKEINRFLAQFQLTPDEIDVLHRAAIDQPMQAKTFFNALQRLKVAHSKCKIMIEKHNYNAGFELLESLGQHQDMAYQRLFESVKTKCEAVNEGNSTEEIDVILQISIHFLKELPAYYTPCQDLIILSRRTQLVSRFVLALTQGGALGQVYRAIDIHAHDSVRYVSDMLAWMHQAIASEQEFLETIFGSNTKSRFQESDMEYIQLQDYLSPYPSSSNVDGSEAIGSTVAERIDESVGLSTAELLARCLQGLGRPLRVRIMQTLENRAGLEVLYPLTDLLTFYEQTFYELVPMENAVHSTVKGCLLESKRLLMSYVHKQADQLVQTTPEYPIDLNITTSTKDCARQIREVLRVLNHSLSPLPTSPEDEGSVSNVLGLLVQPQLQACRIAAQLLQGADVAIFMLNNISAIQHELTEASKRSEMSREMTAPWLGLLQSEHDVWVELVVREETARALHRSGIDKLFEIIEVLPSDLIASQQPGLEPKRVFAVLQSFYTSLLTSVSSHYGRLTDPETREYVRSESSAAVAEIYMKVHEVVSSADNLYDPTILAHNVDEVRVLLGLRVTN